MKQPSNQFNGLAAQDEWGDVWNGGNKLKLVKDEERKLSSMEEEWGEFNTPMQKGGYMRRESSMDKKINTANERRRESEVDDEWGASDNRKVSYDF